MCLRYECSSRILLEYRGSQCCENLILDSEMTDGQYKYLTNSSLQVDLIHQITNSSNLLMSQGKEWNAGSRLSLVLLSLITPTPHLDSVWFQAVTIFHIFTSSFILVRSCDSTSISEISYQIFYLFHDVTEVFLFSFS